jgi:microcystin-dependent protein
MKRVLSVKEKEASQTTGSLKAASHRGFSRGLVPGLILLAVLIVLSGGLLYGQGSVDALFIDEKGTVKVQELEVTAGRIKDKTGFVMPVGTILPYGGQEVPEGWLECNGDMVSRKDYPDLFEAIGTLWGTGDQEGTFRLPDLRGQFLRGQDHGAHVDPDIDLREVKSGADGANKDVVGSYQGDEIKTHTHNFNFTYVRYVNNAYDPIHVPPKTHIQGAQADVNDEAFEIKEYGGQETRPKNAYVMFIIKY